MPVNQSPTHEQLQLAKEATDLGIWIWNIEDDQLTWDERTVELFGFSPEAGVDEFYQAVHPDDLDRVKTAVRHSVETGDPYHLRFRIRNDEFERWVEAHGKVTEEREEKPIRMIGSIQDVTEETLKTQELVFSEKR